MSKSNKMLIDASHPEETRVVVVRDGRVEEFDFESASRKPLRGNIYLAKITRVEPSLQAAFVEYGGNRHGFLAFNEIHPDYYQIPMADRVALLEEEAAQEAAEEAEADAHAERLARRRNGRPAGEAVEDRDAEVSSRDGSSRDGASRDGRQAGGRDGGGRDGDNRNGGRDGRRNGRRQRGDRGGRARGPRNSNDGVADDNANPIATGAIDGRNLEASVMETGVSEQPLVEAGGIDAGAHDGGIDNGGQSSGVDQTSQADHAHTDQSAAEASHIIDDEPSASRDGDHTGDGLTADRPQADSQPDQLGEPADDVDTTGSAPPRGSRAARIDRHEDAIREDAPDRDADGAAGVTDQPEAPHSASDATAHAADPGDGHGQMPARDDDMRDDRSDARADSEQDDDDSDEDDEADDAEDEAQNDGDGLVQVRSEPVEIDVIEPEGAEDLVEEVAQRPRRRMRSYKIQEVIKRRQVVLVQVVKEERGNKGAALTTYLSLAGRYTVLMPNTARGGGISRKITNTADRKRLKTATQELDVPEGMGLIVRTAGAAREGQEIKRDFEYLLRLWESVRELTLQSTAPTLVYEEGNLVKRSIRDLYNKDIEDIIVAGEAGYREAHDFMRMLSPSQAKSVVHYQGHEPLLARYRVEQQLAALFSPQVTLKSGGYLVINQTEALVAIDVNSGKSTREYSIEDTALNTNLEAAEEVARQVKLRDLAGLIVIDFIDMEEKRNNRAVERRLKDSLRHDRARIQLGRISHFGLMEMSRQRLRTGVVEGSTSQCPHCQGSGIIRSIESIALAVLRGIEDALMAGTRMALIAHATPQVALYILNSKRGYIIDMEARHGLPIAVQGSDKLQGANFTIEKVAAAIEPVRRRTTATPINMEWGFDDSEEDAATIDVSPRNAEPDDEDRDVRLDRSRDGNRDAGSGARVANSRGEAESSDEEQSADGSRRRRRRRGRRGRRDEHGAEGDVQAVAGEDDYGSQPVGGYDGEEQGEEQTGGIIEVGGVDDVDGDGDDEGDLDGASVKDADGDGRSRRGRRRGRRGGRRGQGSERGERDAGSAMEAADAAANGTLLAYLEDGSLAPASAGDRHVAEAVAVDSGAEPSGDVAGSGSDRREGSGRRDHREPRKHRERTIDTAAAARADAEPVRNDPAFVSTPLPPDAVEGHPVSGAEASSQDTMVEAVHVEPVHVAAVHVEPIIIEPVHVEPPKPRRTTVSSEPVIERVVVGTSEAVAAVEQPAPRRGWWQQRKA
ncbi:MAG: Rne/Rng family ribonuclease [Hyphomicrobium aestuarii]|nr:Rne/Rng family ribonuclease [Hyphomicrobium aestuarii]